MSNEASHCLFVFVLFFSNGVSYIDWDTIERIRSRGENIDANLERAESPKTRKTVQKVSEQKKEKKKRKNKQAEHYGHQLNMFAHLYHLHGIDDY